MPFISVEGVDGSGKTTQTALLVDYLQQIGRRVIRTKEPDGGRLGAEVRAILTNPRHVLSPLEQLLLVNAARTDHVRSVIRPAINAGAWVVCDRFVDSTYAFQVAAAEHELLSIHEAAVSLVVGDTLPDLTIILDLPIEVARGRREARNGSCDDPAEKSRDFVAIRAALIEAARRAPSRCRIVDANRDPQAVAADVRGVVGPLL